MTPSVASVQRLAFFSLRIPDSGLGCDVGSARDPIKREGHPPTAQRRACAQNALLREGPTPECVFPQNALFLNWANAVPPHVKAHSG